MRSPTIAFFGVHEWIKRQFKDFGKGFYTTELEEQARNMAKRT
jgi:hypothetical protein